MNGVRGLSAQEVGVYTMLLCRIYEENGPVEYHPLRLATYCGMRVPTFESVVKKLVDLGKITIAENMLSNARAETEIAKRSDDLKNNSKAGKASAEKRQQNQQNNPTGVQQAFNHTDTDTDTKETISKDIGADAPKVGFWDECVEVLTSKGTPERSARAMLGKWSKIKGQNELQKIVKGAANAADPVSVIEAALIGPKPADKLRLVAEQIKTGKPFLCARISSETARQVLAAGLVTKDQCIAARVNF